MRAIVYIALYGLCVCCVLIHAQSTRPQFSDAVQQLLSMPAPPPRTSTETAEINKQRPQQFYDKSKTPPDDAPTNDLLDYWERWADSSERDGPKPSNVVKNRLLDACASEPARLQRLLPLLPRDETTAQRVKKLYDDAQSNERLDESWREGVHKWLLFHSRSFLSDLLELASKAKDKEGYVYNGEALDALVQVDWSTAEPLLQTLTQGSQLRTAVKALASLHQHARASQDARAEEQYRTRLQAVAADRTYPARARDTAIDALSRADWTGRDEWYLSLLSDETLLEPTDGIYLLSPLTTLFDTDPDKWIPVMTRLVDSKNRSVQQAAASCLVRYATEHPRRDAILPVLRWLSDPDWLPISTTQRAWFLQKMDDLEMPESVPGLIWIVENEDWNRIWAARTLAHYKDHRAVPALQKALLQETNEDHRQYILEGLLASGGVSEGDQLAALWAYAAKLTTPEGRQQVESYRSFGDDPLPVPISIGKYLARMKNVSQSLVRAVLAYAESQQKTNPTQAKALLELTHGWQARQVDLDIIRRIAAGTADSKTIAHALDQRVKLRESVGPAVQDLSRVGGAAQAVAAVLLEDENLAWSVLGSQEPSAQSALIACARLTQMSLPVKQVGSLLRSQHQLLALAAERYLLAEDSEEARRLLWARHSNEAFITGWRENIQIIGSDNFDAMAKVEEKLRAELFKENPPQEIFAFVANDEQVSRVLRVYPDRIIYTHYEDPARYRERVISNEELANFKSFVTTNNLESIGPQFSPCHHDCSPSEFLALTKERGRRVFSYQGITGWINVVANFDLLGRGDGVNVHYRLEDKIKGLEILYADDTLVVKDVWQQSADVRIFVERVETSEELEERQRATKSSDDDDEAARVQRRHEEAVRSKAHFSWRTLASGKMGAITTQPEIYSTLDDSKFELNDDEFPSHLNQHLTQAASKDFVVLAGDTTRGGLWKKTARQKAIRISGEGVYANPVVTPDGKWVVAAKTDTDWSRPNQVVRINLQTGREHHVTVPAADQFEPVAYVAAHDRVLLRRAADDRGSLQNRSVGPSAPEFYLLDAATGEARLVRGVFAPLCQEGKRFLEQTNIPNEFWAAIPDRGANRTEVGRYNVKEFSFEPLLVVPHITFDSMSMWIDEAGAKLYLVYEGHLLRLPLKAAQ